MFKHTAKKAFVASKNLPNYFLISEYEKDKLTKLIFILETREEEKYELYDAFIISFLFFCENQKITCLVNMLLKISAHTFVSAFRPQSTPS